MPIQNSKKAVGSSYMSIWCQQMKCIIDLLLCYTPSNIQEVGWFPTMKLYNVHCCHSETSTINCKKRKVIPDKSQQQYPTVKVCTLFSTINVCWKHKHRSHALRKIVFRILLSEKIQISLCICMKLAIHQAKPFSRDLSWSVSLLGTYSQTLIISRSFFK